MRATGIVRRIDDLGRVVIPKEIRRTQHIRQGDPLEIFTTGDGEVVFKKYSPIGELSAFAGQYTEVLARNLSVGVLVCDRDHIVAAAGPARRECAQRRVSLPLEKIMESRAVYRHSGQAGECLFPCEGVDRHILLAAPILAQGDVIGAVLLLESDRAAQPTPEQEKAASIAAAFLGKQMEE